MEQKSLNALLVGIIVLLSSQLANAQNIQFKKGNWSEALGDAKKENKLIFVDIYATWCGPCRAMAKNVFTQQKVADQFNSKFINYMIDAEKGEGPMIAEKYKVGSFPTYLFIDGEGNLVYKIEGAMDADKFLTEADNAVAKLKK
jgi:thiol:disulfide interchange protein